MTFVLDENLPPCLADALRALGEPVEAAGRGPVRGSSDAQLAQHVGELGGLLISRDRRMLQNPATVAALVTARVGLCVMHEGQASAFELGRRLIWAWPELRRHAAMADRPFFQEITVRGTLRAIRPGR